MAGICYYYIKISRQIIDLVRVFFIRGSACGRNNMTKELAIELFGYLGSFLVLVSFLMTSVAKLRIVNTVGSVIFMIYAIIIKSYPTAVMNFCLVLINLRFLWKMSRMGKEYETVKVTADDTFLKYLLEHYGDDIRECFPGIKEDFSSATDYYVVVCEGTPVGLTIGRRNGKTLDIFLDYSIPQYRDFSIGNFLIRKFEEEGIRKLIYRGPDEKHRKFLDNMGYVQVDGEYIREI